MPKSANRVPTSRWSHRPATAPTATTSPGLAPTNTVRAATPPPPTIRSPTVRTSTSSVGRSARAVREDGTPRVAPGVYRLTRDASPQFHTPITVRVIRERTDRNSFDGWTWIEVYVLDTRGDATDRRELFVRPGGMRPAPPPAAPRRTPVRRYAPRAAR